MVTGFESFRTHFAGYEDCYTIIGGAACDILMSDAGVEFRATKDVDIILLIEERFPAFAKLFWDYVKAGGYRCGWKKEEAPRFYRFTEPSSNNYPSMIELFSRRPDFQIGHEDIHLTPLPVTDEISSLSAIMLDDDYYHLMLQGRKTVSGVSVLDAEYLITFKVKAWLDLTEKKANGIHVNDRDLRKHRADVFRLYAIVDPSKHIELPLKIQEEMRRFLSLMEQESLNMQQYGLDGLSLKNVLEGLRTIYLLNA